MTASQAARGAERGASAPSVVTTKLRPPRLRPGLIERRALLERLRDGRSRKLTLVCAPAGYGKSTLLAQWLVADRKQATFTWLSLDELDDDPIRLWTHVVVGLQAGNGKVGRESLAALAGGPRAIPERVLPLLIHELEDSPPRVLVLEDWHAVRNPVCDQTMAAFVERSPESLQVVISSRSDPGLPVARLRAHGDLLELRTSDLRVSSDQATELFSAADVRLGRRDVLRLTKRTEGWLAGLCLALIAVKTQPDSRRFVANFSGDSGHVLDYLARDVLDAVPFETRRFLLRTSILRRLSGPLCDAVLERSGSAATLARIEKSNLFLIPLDEGNDEYRYHYLFASMLSRELARTDPDAIPGLHDRASEWLEAHGEVEAAVEHAIASADVERASTLVARYSPAFWSSGRIATLVRWLQALSWPEAVADPQLALLRANIQGLAGAGSEEIERWLQVAEEAPDYGRLANGIASLRSGAAMVRSAYLTRGPAEAEKAARLALELEPPESTWRRPALVGLGQALYFLGREEEARAPLEEARGLPGARDRTPGAALGLAYLALVRLGTGDTSGALRTAKGALRLLEEHHLTTGVAAANPHLALGVVLAEGADLHAAIEHLERAVDLIAPSGPTFWRAHALVRLAAARHRLGDAVGAGEALAAAGGDLEQLPVAGMLDSLYEETRDLLSGKPRREGFLGDELSPAELRILRALARGGSLSDAARALWLSQHTVKTHRRSIYRKLGATTRDEMVARATDLRLLDGEPAPEREESTS